MVYTFIYPTVCFFFQLQHQQIYVDKLRLLGYVVRKIYSFSAFLLDTSFT